MPRRNTQGNGASVGARLAVMIAAAGAAAVGVVTALRRRKGHVDASSAQKAPTTGK